MSYSLGQRSSAALAHDRTIPAFKSSSKCEVGGLSRRKNSVIN
jgi:hypothetical protein